MIIGTIYIVWNDFFFQQLNAISKLLWTHSSARSGRPMTLPFCFWNNFICSGQKELIIDEGNVVWHVVLYVTIARNSVLYRYTKPPLATSPRRGLCNNVKVTLSRVVIFTSGHRESAFQFYNQKLPWLLHIQKTVIGRWLDIVGVITLSICTALNGTATHISGYKERSANQG